MSCFFLIDNEDVWNPSNFVANLTLGNIQTIAQSLAIESGASDIMDDECHFDGNQFTRFIEASLEHYSTTNNELLHDMLRSTIGIGIVMLRRAGHEPAFDTEPKTQWLKYADSISASMHAG